MKRRKLLKTGAIITGYAFLMGGTAATLHSCKSTSSTDWQPQFLTEDEAELIAEIAERILPRTDTPGAKDAKVHRFIDANIHLNFDEEQKIEFREGLTIFDEKSRNNYKKAFIKINDDQKDEILQELEVEASDGDDENPHIWQVMKDMTKYGFFTSEVGAKEFFAYDPIPGEYNGCIDYSTIGATWAIG